jgi:hypothetical protein
MVVWFTTTYAISVYHHWCCEFETWSGRGVQHYVIKVVSDLRGFSPGPPVSSTNKTDSHNVAEILLKVVLNTIKQPNERKWLIVHTFVFAKFCRSAFQQTVNIPYCALRPVNLFHFIFEADFIYEFLTKSEKKLAKAFHFTFHFIDYVLSLNNCNIGDNVDRIYPTKIDKKDTTDSVRPGSLRVPVNKESTETSG